MVESEWEFAEIANNILIFHHDIQQEKILINDKRLDHYRIEIDLEKELIISIYPITIKTNPINPTKLKKSVCHKAP